MTTELQTESSNKNLYEQDYCLWLEKTASLLRDRHLELLDFEHLIEEIEDMGRGQRNELKSRLIQLFIHLLKYQYQPEKRSSSWIGTIWEQHYQIQSLLEDSPSLNNYYEAVFSDCYPKAVRAASSETKLPATVFPPESPFPADRLIDSDFIEAFLSQND